MKRIVTTAVVAVVAVLALSSSGEAWTVEFGEWQTGERQLRIPGGNAGRLEITARGDSAYASFVTEGPAQELKGRVEGNKVVLRGTRAARINMNGTESEVTLQIVFEVTAAAGELTGVHRMGRDGDEPVWRSLKARPAT
jgi:hypothetical protein